MRGSQIWYTLQENSKYFTLYHFFIMIDQSKIKGPINNTQRLIVLCSENVFQNEILNDLFFLYFANSFITIVILFMKSIFCNNSLYTWLHNVYVMLFSIEIGYLLSFSPAATLVKHFCLKWVWETLNWIYQGTPRYFSKNQISWRQIFHQTFRKSL